MYEVCDICFGNVDMDYLLDHKDWHRRLGHLPAQTREDRSGRLDPTGYTTYPDTPASPERDPVAERPDMAMTCGCAPGTHPPEDTLEVHGPSRDIMVKMVDCDHNWPPELEPDSRCTKCGMPYDVWDKTMRHL